MFRLWILLLAMPHLALAAQFDWDAPIDHDPAITVGTLSNGLTYYIKENARPANRVFLRLVVNAGSILEDEDQLGVAHFLEHMAFNGTAHFESTQVVSFLESIGASMGADLNAYTSFDETVYMLEIPTDKPELLDQGILILRDWAGAITLDPREIEKERGVILDEWRRGQGAGERIRKQLWPVVLRDSRYAERMPIGTPEIIESVPRERLEAYYRAWYRPELMAVIAVGSLDKDRVEALIRENFESLTAPPDPPEREIYSVPPHQETLVVTATDDEQPGTNFQLLFKHPVREQGTLRAYRSTIIEGLVSGMLNQRLSEIALQPEAPFLGAGAGASNFARSVDVFTLAATTEEGRGLEGFEAALIELRRAVVHGFTQAELDRVKAELLSAVEIAYNERDKSESGSFSAEFTRNFLEGEPIPGIVVEFAMLQELLPSVTMEEVRNAFDRLVHSHDRVITGTGFGELPTEQELLDLVLRVDFLEPEPYVDTSAGEPLLAQEPEPGVLVATRSHEELGITELLYENGVSVWLKPTDFKNDQIVIRGVGTPGLCLAERGNYSNAKLAIPALSMAGFGGHGAIELERMLAGKQVSVRTYIDDFSFGVAGASSQKDIETALQLVYVTMTDPNHDPESYEVFRNQMRNMLEHRKNMPQTKYSEELLRVNYGNHFMRQPITERVVDRLKMDQGLSFYRDMFGNAAGLRFFMVGSFEVGEVMPLLTRYLGALPGDPGASRRECRDPGIRFPRGTRNVKVFAGVEPKADVTLTWNAPPTRDEMEMFRLRMAIDILEIRLRNVLREQLGNTYTVGVGHSQSATYDKYATTSVRFGCAPANVDTMVQVVFDEIERFKADGPTAEELAKVQEMERRNVEEGLETNGYWVSSLTTLYLLSWDPARILDRLNRIDRLSTGDLTQEFRHYFPETNHTQVTLLPESEAPGAGSEDTGGD